MQNVKRWGVLFAILLNVGFNYRTILHPIHGQNIKEISDKYPSVFAPASYAFSIWGIIYLALIIYGIVQVLPKQKKIPIYDQLALPLITINLLSIGWLIIFSYEYLGLSTGIIFLMLAIAIFLFIKTKKWSLIHPHYKFIAIPFSLYASWLTAASIASTSTWLYGLGWRGGIIGEALWTVILIFVATGIGVFMSWKYKDLIYPLVIAWAILAVAKAHQNSLENTSVVLVGIATAIILVIWVLVYGIKLFKSPLNNHP